MKRLLPLVNALACVTLCRYRGTVMLEVWPPMLAVCVLSVILAIVRMHTDFEGLDPTVHGIFGMLHVYLLAPLLGSLVCPNMDTKGRKQRRLCICFPNPSLPHLPRLFVLGLWFTRTRVFKFGMASTECV